MAIKKIFGWILIFGGITIIGYTLYSSYNIFTAKVLAPEIFKIPEKEIVLAPKPRDIEAQMKEMIAEQLRGMIPVDFLPKLLNLVSWSIFAGILIFSGAQVASLGIKLLKE